MTTSGEPMMRLQCLDETIDAVNFGGERFAVSEQRYIVVPHGAAAELTRQPGAKFTHILPAPVVVRAAQGMSEMLPAASTRN